MRTPRPTFRKRLSLAAAIAATLPSLPLQAEDSRMILNLQGAPVFQLRFFDVTDGPFKWGPGPTATSAPAPAASTWNLSELQKSQIQMAAQYWANIITPAPGTVPAVINIGTYDDDNAEGFGGYAPTVDDHNLTNLQAALLGKPTGPLDFGANGHFSLGTMKFNSTAYTPSQLPLNAEKDMTAVALHEIAHALGITSSISDAYGMGENAPFIGPLNSWAAGLRDDNGNPSRPMQAVACTLCNPAANYFPGDFDVHKNQAYFTGEHVNEVLAGSMPGIPVSMYDDFGHLDRNYMSHSELKRSLMSHQNYRNYVTFMEAELAALQDLGYSIDRRNFFGYSVYGDNQTLVNQNGYYQRNAEGTEYLVGQYNTAPLGVGLHVYGSHNRLQQAADLLTRGDGGAGIRVDGVDNTLVINPGTRVHADGLNGRGVLFAYGSQHNFVQRGDVQALGEGGIAAEFNFGNNVMDNDTEYRGSYIYSRYHTDPTVMEELGKDMLDAVDISGRLAGSAAAISMSSNAFVYRINILNGASLQGDIRSRYLTPFKPSERSLTQLSFGYLADADGRALTVADPNFKFSYGDNIDGIDSIDIKAVGGTTTLNGTNQVYNVDVAEGATLSGTGKYLLNKAGVFTNSGTVAPGGAIGSSLSIDGDYTQTATGKLLLAVNSTGTHDSVSVSGKAKLDGLLDLLAEPGWYAPSWKLNTADLLKAGSTEGDFSQITANFASPTLTLLDTRLANNSHDLSVTRAANAYSQYAQSQNAAAVGAALSNGATPDASADRQKLYTTLDFSAPDGSTIAKALEQLSPAAYSAMLASSVQREQQVADAISKREPGRLKAGEWQSFIQPFGGNTRQNGDSHSIGYTSNNDGVIFGAETIASVDGALVLGLHGAASKQSVSLKDPLNGKGTTRALELGVHARYALDPMVGPYMLGSARVGYEEGDLKRTLNFADYSAQNKADWTGKSASVVGGGGYRFALNEMVSVGPVATLTYTSLWRDSTHEKGADGSTLKLDSQQFDSLRSSIGLNSALALPLGAGQAIKAEAQLTWNHELLDTDVLQDATFANYPASGFSSKNSAYGRDSMGLGGSVRYQLSKDIDIGAGVSSDLFRTGYNAVSGNLSLDWRF